MRYIIGFNGPKSIGKSWTVDRLIEMVPGSNVSKESLMAIPWDNLIAMYGDEWPLMHDYHNFKNHVFADEKTGRQKIIEYVEGERKKDPLVWVKAWLDSLEKTEEDRLYLIESVGFKVEVEYFEEVAGVEYSTCVIAPTDISIYRKFDEKDSRVALKPTARMRFYNSNKAFETFQRRIRNARGSQDNSEPLPVKKIWEALHMGRLME